MQLVSYTLSALKRQIISQWSLGLPPPFPLFSPLPLFLSPSPSLPLPLSLSSSPSLPLLFSPPLLPLGAYVVQALAERLDQLLRDPPNYGQGKECNCVLLLLAFLYNYKVRCTQLCSYIWQLQGSKVKKYVLGSMVNIPSIYTYAFADDSQRWYQNVIASVGDSLCSGTLLVMEWLAVQFGF